MAKYIKTKTGYKTQAYIGKYPDGKRAYKRLEARTKTELDLLVATCRAEFEKGNNILASPEMMTLEEAFKRYVQSKTAILSPSTLRIYEQCGRLYFNNIQHLPLSEITPEIIQIAINDLASKRAPKTVRNAHGFLSAVLKEYAPHIVLNTKLPQKIKAEIEVPSHDQIKALIDASKNTFVEPIILLAAYGGLRRSEICALNRKDIFLPTDSDNPVVLVNKALVRNSAHQWVLKTTKTYSSTRSVPIPIHVYHRLVEVLPEVGKITPHNPDTITNAFQRMVQSLGFSMRLHDLRHYYASVMLALNIPNKYAISLMGHSTDNMLKTVYQHLMEDKKTEAVNDLISFFNSKYEA